MQTAIITGVSGQIGSYLAEYLITLGHHVIGIDRRKSTVYGWGSNIKSLVNNQSFELVYGDIKDSSFINRLVSKYRPHKLFLLAAQSHVGQSFLEPLETFDTDARATLIALEAVRLHSPSTKIYFSATSELFGGIDCPSEGYTEENHFHPRSPYGVAKLSSYWAVKNYREAYGLFACSGIFFNNESPRRGADFVTRKITLGVASILKGNSDTITLGNIDAYRDWGYSKEYCEVINLILERDTPEEFVIATGESYSVRDWLRFSLEAAGLPSSNWKKYVSFDSKYMRPSEVPFLKGNPSKSKDILGWEAKVKAPELASIMTA